MIHARDSLKRFLPGAGVVPSPSPAGPASTRPKAPASGRNNESDNSRPSREAPKIRWVTVVVCDQGVGIPEHRKSQLFQSFQAFAQLDAKALKRGQGTRLGLVVAQQIIELHGGEVVFESTVGAGSRFGFKVSADVRTQYLSRHVSLCVACLRLACCLPALICCLPAPFRPAGCRFLRALVR
jgi:hypothetical protein